MVDEFGAPVGAAVWTCNWREAISSLETVRVVIVDDFEPLRKYICSLLAGDSELEIVHVSSDGLDAVQRCEELQPDVVVMDIGLPTINGLEAARQIRVVSPDSRIVFLSTHESPMMIREALKIGAGYVVKRNADRELMPAVRAAVQELSFVRFRVVTAGPAEPAEA